MYAARAPRSRLAWKGLSVAFTVVGTHPIHNLSFENTTFDRRLETGKTIAVAIECGSPDELHEIISLIQGLQKPAETFIDGDIEDALAEAGFIYPSKTIYVHDDFPHFVVKADEVDVRLRTANRIRDLLATHQITTPRTTRWNSTRDR